MIDLSRRTCLTSPFGERSTLFGRVRGPFPDAVLAVRPPHPALRADLSPKGEVHEIEYAGRMNALAPYKRLTIKIGSALLVDKTGKLRAAWLADLAADIAALKAGGCEVVIVSSGAIALGRGLLGLVGRGADAGADRRPPPVPGRLR